ncbi:DUF4304 domain-containing protein [Vibrio vulnificus]|uniref:DUF4304 domain-containing protein n=1 Tax=Vibrio vulnificus TaxID=672 RepID=UPI0024DF7C2E|nr:DUF4304 domain-containing protein [Vibrio vulnificus]EKO5173772.1 DUF4304 domain-containing protein [Vibrio vulnificus]EKO5194257.1 DUF4304 domain-containing protein [Vibrio vulnificus]ELK2036129.1 DUF4304 domain-containing protein [Vibrio vulnificus]ELK2281909.1 DUF4304 domain-containing protein [Vibrio vulnificus]MDK2603498.1 DUF4304 domain-containing protein [Vibrio vulnificus]
MADSKLVKEALGAPLKEAGFKKKSDSWYWSNDEVVLLVNLQKSQYGDQYYVNGGVALKSLGAVDFPKDYHCHIRFRLTAVVSEEESKKIELAFDLENESLSDLQRKEEILRLVKGVALPILKGCSTKSGIAETVKSGRLAKAMIHKQLKDLVI